MRGLIYDENSYTHKRKRSKSAKVMARDEENRIVDIELDQPSSCYNTSSMHTVSVAHQTKILPLTEEENQFKSADINNDESKIQILN